MISSLNVNKDRKKGEALIFSLGGMEFSFRKRMKNTFLAGFTEERPESIARISDMVTSGGDVKGKMFAQITQSVVRGFTRNEMNGVLEFLAESIASVSGAESETGTPIDWNELDVKKRVDFLDYQIEPMTAFTLFMLAWLEYQGLKGAV